jgi:acyl-CoA reductase-like NAD-dependent aldehyde dehydrogenase
VTESRKILAVVNPATGETVQELACDSAASVAEKYRAARSAQPAWAAVPLAAKRKSIRRFRDLLAAKAESLAAVLTLETGKPIAQARREIAGVRERIDFFLAKAGAALGPEVVRSDRASGMTERITREPLGVIANISAWNYPYFVGGNVFLPALLAGNTVLYKPSEWASLSGLAMAQLLHDSGIPREAFIPIVGGAAAGEALLRQPIDGIFFTGSYRTGRRIAAKAAERLIKVQLELGGKDPVYVCEDAPIARAAAGIADGAFYNTGQSCCSVERIYVHATIFPRFVAAFVKAVKGFKIGDPMKDSTYLGPITRPAQIEVLEAQVKDARKKGARVLLGGGRVPRRPGYFQPTVLVDVDHTMTVMREESFGPVVGLMAVRDDAEAVALMNDTDYGLTAGVYTPDRRRAESVLAQVKSGTSYWNCCDRVSPRLPWSGVGQSGIGVTLSTHGIQAFTRPRAWHLREAR